MDDLVEKLKIAKPRRVECSRAESPLVIFTDGACEDNLVTVGAVIFEGDRAPEYFGHLVPDRVWQHWKRKSDQSQVIGQAEIAPVLIAKLTWADRVRGRRVIFFIDNEAARIGLVRSFSPSLPSLRLIGQSIDLDLILCASSWYARVPAVANPADLPSRLAPSTYLDSLGAVSVSPCLPPNW